MQRHLFFLTLLPISLLLSCQPSSKGSQGENFTQNINKVSADIQDDSKLLTFFDRPIKSIPFPFENLPTGSVRPQGWILAMMENDLEKGMVGALDDLYPGIKSDDLYHTARRGGMEDIPEMGDLVLTGAAWETSIMWWNAETAGNWWEGFVRHAFLTNNSEAIQQSKDIVNNLLDSQDEDGYIGIYKPNLRYQHEGSNGELWAQTTAFRTMLAYHELTGEKRVLDAVEKAMALTMKEYGPKGRNPFLLKNAFGGVTHGLMITDVCETLHRITGKEEYLDFATYLYRAFSTYNINRSFNDMRFPYLSEVDSPFTGHAVHTYEHLRSLVQAGFHTGYPELAEAFQSVIGKLGDCLLPSGAGHGNEWIAGMKADPDLTATEYCSMLELRNSFFSIFQKTNNLDFANFAEKLTFNGMMGFRNEDGTALTYGKADNCSILDGHHHAHDQEKTADPRYKYSPTHSEPAVCCVPNYGRNLPYYLDNMWMRKEDGCAAILYGPSTLNINLNGKEVQIEQLTKFPFSDEVEFKIGIEAPLSFPIFLRKTAWSKNIEINIEGASIVEEENFIRIQKEWKDGESFDIRFLNKVEVKEFNPGQSFVQRGPLLFAYPIPYEKKVIKDYPDTHFSDYYCLPSSEEHKNLMFTQDFAPRLVQKGLQESSDPWKSKPLSLTVNMFNNKSGKSEEVSLVPMGSTVLRQLTFPIK